MQDYRYYRRLSAVRVVSRKLLVRPERPRRIYSQAMGEQEESSTTDVQVHKEHIVDEDKTETGTAIHQDFADKHRRVVLGTSADTTLGLGRRRHGIPSRMEPRGTVRQGSMSPCRTRRSSSSNRRRYSVCPRSLVLQLRRTPTGLMGGKVGPMSTFFVSLIVRNWSFWMKSVAFETCLDAGSATDFGIGGEPLRDAKCRCTGCEYRAGTPLFRAGVNHFVAKRVSTIYLKLRARCRVKRELLTRSRQSN